MAVSETTTQTTKATVAPQGPNGAPKATTPANKATPARKTPKPAKGAKAAKPKKAAASKKATPKMEAGTRKGTKAAKVLEMIRRPNGVTIKEIMKATGWQTHSVRGFISGALVKKMGFKVESVKRKTGDRTYRIAK